MHPSVINNNAIVSQNQEKKQNHPSMVTIFRQSDFQHSSLSTASTAIPSHLDVPDVFNHSSFRIKNPIIGAQIFELLIESDNSEEEEDSEEEEGSENLYSLLIKDNQWGIEDFEIYLDYFLNKSLHKNPLLKYSFSDDDNKNDPTKTARNFDLNSNHLLINLKTFIELNYPVYCTMMRFGRAKEDSLSEKQFREILSYILIFYWIFFRDKYLINKFISQWSNLSSSKSISSFYDYLMEEMPGQTPRAF